MLLTRSFAQRRLTLLALAGALVLCAFFAMPQGRALASTLLLLFRGQTIQPIATTYSDLQNAYKTLQELEKLGTIQGAPPATLKPASNISAAASTAGFSPAQPGNLPNGFLSTPSSIRAVAPSTVTLTLKKPTADAYFKSTGSSMTLPAAYDGEQIVVSFPGVTLLEYSGPNGASAYVGQASQFQVQISGNATADQLRQYLLTLPGLSSPTANALQNITNWQYTIPLGIPADRAGFSSCASPCVGGSYAGSGVILNDNTGIASAVLWQPSSGPESLGVGGKGLTKSQVLDIAGSLH